MANIGLAVALTGILPKLSGGYRIAVCLAIASLVLAAILLLLRDRFQNPSWKRLVDISSNIHIAYTAFGFGVAAAGVSLLRPGWLLIGILFLLAGALLIGAGIGQNLLLLKTFIRAGTKSSAPGSDTTQMITGAWRECSFAGLKVIACRPSAIMGHK
jgi:hypothetical protein